MSTKRPGNLNITPRHPSFPLKASLTRQRYWLDGDPVKSHIFNALQATFPEGERFFIDSARDVRDQLPDGALPETLARDIQAFIHQEAWHGKAHDEWVDVLEGLGYPRMREFDEEIRNLRLWARKHISPLRRLSMTAGSEHLTASLARLILYRRPELLDTAERPVRDLLAWHALEEVEHKAVCFDLYQQAGGGYQMRITGLAFSIMDLLKHLHQGTKYLLQEDGLWTWRNRIKLTRELYGRKGLFTSLLPDLLQYLKPGFHPWDTDERADLHERFGDLLDPLEEAAA